MYLLLTVGHGFQFVWFTDVSPIFFSIFKITSKTGLIY